MDFLHVIDSVKKSLNTLSIQEKTKLFKDVLNYPIDYIDGIFYVSSKEYSQDRIKDYLSIREYWMNLQEFNKLYYYFGKS